MAEDRRTEVFPEHVQRRLDEILSWVAPPLEAEELAVRLTELHDVEVLVTGWGGGYLTDEMLDAMPKLALVVVASGSVRHVAGPNFWARDIPIVSAASANAIPVIEFSVANIVLGLKQAFRMARLARSAEPMDRTGIEGTFGTTVGLLSLGQIGRGVLAELERFDVGVLAYDPMATESRGATLTDLETVFARSQVVSIHTPLLPSTRGMIGHSLLRSMPFGSTVLNTSRGAIIDEAALIDVMRERPDLTAMLDVTSVEPLPLGSPLRSLPNVVLTGHIAGSLGRERARVGILAAEEAERFARGEPLMHRVDPKSAATRA